MSVRVIEADPPVEILIEYLGVLDLRGAETIVSAIASRPVAPSVVIDLSKAPHVHDSALSRIVDAVPPSRRLRFRGTGLHQARLLHYLGVRFDRLEDQVA